MQFQQYSHPDDAPTELWISGLTQDSVGYTTGLAATDRPELPGYNSGVLCMVIAMMLLVIFNARHYGRFFRRLVKNVWSIRVRTNLFDEHTVNETRIMIALIVQVCVCESLLGVTWMTSHGYTFTSGGLAAAAAIGTLITCLYYVAQIVVYRIVGYAFTSRLLCIQWIQGFNSTQTLLASPCSCLPLYLFSIRRHLKVLLPYRCAYTSWPGLCLSAKVLGFFTTISSH